MPADSSSVPPPSAVPEFEPVRAGGSRRHRLRRVVRRRRRAVAVSLAVAAAALAVSALDSGAAEPQPRERASPEPGQAEQGERAERAERSVPAAAELVRAPVRIADPAAARLLRPGDRVDVLASAADPGDGSDRARIVARRVRVADVPETEGAGEAREPAADGALVVLSVPRSTAVELADAAAHSRVAVALW